MGPDSARGDHPKQVLIIRHGEKPRDPSSIHLSSRGAARARALTSLFQGSSNRFDPPHFLFAARRTKKSNRSVETLQPLSQALELRIDDTYRDDEYGKLAREIVERSADKYAQKAILICWHHGSIPLIAQGLGVQHPCLEWPDEAFDQIWEIDYIDDCPRLRVHPQMLLFGDSSKRRTERAASWLRRFIRSLAKTMSGRRS
jgi:broad specificity phosphatase PhoE